MELILKNITKQYKKFIALDSINFNFTDGVYGLVGPNGAGKSTLMKIITGVLSPSAGKVEFNNISIETLSEKYRENLGYLPQNIEFYPSYSVYQMMKYLCHLKGISAESIEDVIDNCLEKVALQEHRNKKTSKLSGGMKRRLGIAQAIIGEPKIIILDEPTAGLDPNERMRLRNLIAGLGSNHIVILSTHIVSDIEAAAKEIIFLRSGKIAKSGSISDILSELEEKVWELTCNEKIYNEMLLNHIAISALQVSGEQVNIRYVGNRYNESSMSVEPRLEDIYLDVFGEVSAE